MKEETALSVCCLMAVLVSATWRGKPCGCASRCKMLSCRPFSLKSRLFIAKEV